MDNTSLFVQESMIVSLNTNVGLLFWVHSSWIVCTSFWTASNFTTHQKDIQNDMKGILFQDSWNNNQMIERSREKKNRNSSLTIYLAVCLSDLQSLSETVCDCLWWTHHSFHARQMHQASGQPATLTSDENDLVWKLFLMVWDSQKAKLKAYFKTNLHDLFWFSSLVLELNIFV